MNTILDLIDEGDFCALPILILILTLCGVAMTGGDSTLLLWGKRSAAGVSLLYAVHAYFEFRPTTALDFLGLAVRCVLAGGLALGPSWIVLAISQYAWKHSFGLVIHGLRSWRESVRIQREHAAEQRQLAFQDHDRLIGDQSRVSRESDARQRRHDARAKSTRAYHLLKPKLADRFTEDDFTKYLATYLGDDKSPDDVEYQATKLIQLLKQLSERPGTGVNSCGALNQRFEQQKAAIAAAPIDDELRDILIRELEEQYEEEFRRLIREQRP